jgi:acyl-CoA synthetase (AMP-forming)/AMP-acid ligase II
VAIVNPETTEICLSHEIGEIWVSSEANVQPYIGRTPISSSSSATGESDAMVEATRSRFHARIAPTPITDCGSGVGGDLQQQHQEQQQRQLESKTYVRTGEIGFLWNYATPEFNGGQPTSLLFVLGPIGETFEVQGLLHFPVDVEKTVEGAHPNFASDGR